MTITILITTPVIMVFTVLSVQLGLLADITSWGRTPDCSTWKLNSLRGIKQPFGVNYSSTEGAWTPLGILPAHFNPWLRLRSWSQITLDPQTTQCFINMQQDFETSCIEDFFLSTFNPQNVLKVRVSWLYNCLNMSFTTTRTDRHQKLEQN